MNPVRRILEKEGVRPRKKWGQSFLHDEKAMQRIVAAVDPQWDDTVVEIGAGLGLLTEALAQRAGRVIALEIDKRLLGILEKRLAGFPSVDVVPGDVLAYDFSKAVPDGQIKVVGNVPYHISTPILFHLLDHRRAISTMTLMFQKELADRIMASPGGKTYGIPSVILARYGQIDHEATLPPESFYPAPSVYSSIIRIRFQDRPLPEVREDLFRRVVRTAFGRRRKTLRNNLRGLGLPEERLQQAFTVTGIDGGRRAETLSAREYAALVQAISENGWIGKGLDSDEGIC